MSKEAASTTENVVVQSAPSNGLGTAGFVVSLLGLFLTCGVLSPVGLFFSGLAIFRKPRGMAFAGTVLGVVGTIWLGVVGVVVAACFWGVGGAIQTGSALNKAKQTIEEHKEKTGRLPAYRPGNELIGEIVDGWNTRVRYHAENGEAVITSAGPDGEFDTSDDLSSKDKMMKGLGGGGGGFGQLTGALEKLNKPAKGGPDLDRMMQKALGGKSGGKGGVGGPPGLDGIPLPPPR